MNYCDFLFQIRKDLLQNIALVDAGSDRRYSYFELQVAVKNLAGHLNRIGFNSGDIISTHLYNSAEAVLAHLAIQYLGGVTCLLDPLITPESLGYYIKDSRSVGLISHLSRAVVEKNVAGDFRFLTAEESTALADQTEKDRHLTSLFEYSPEQLAAIFYTSGTTHQPKGVMLCPRNFRAHFEIFSQSCYRYAPEDKLLCFVPFSHGYGSKSIFIPCVHAGATFVIMRSFQPYKVAEVIERENITHLFGVPSHYQQLLRKPELLAPLKKLKAAFSAAALLKLETARDWKETVGFYLDEGYGLIETCTGVAFRRGKMPDRLGNIGNYPMDLVSIEIADDSLNLLPAGERGEIVVRGECVMLGYLNKPEETRRAVQDGWFRTGDMGYKTLQNEIVLTGRIKDVINVAGIKVAPFEVEAALNEHPAVVESAVIGVEDEIYGEVVKAFVKKQDNDPLEERDLKLYLQKKLINFQIPKEIVFVDQFPRNNMGKTDKKTLRLLHR